MKILCKIAKGIVGVVCVIVANHFSFQLIFLNNDDLVLEKISLTKPNIGCSIASSTLETPDSLLCRTFCLNEFDPCFPLS
jgi:hypothetical protein